MKYRYTIAFSLILLFSSCSESFLDLNSSTSQNRDKVKTLADVEMILNGVYNILSDNDYYNNSYLARNDVRADDMLSLSSSRLGTENRYLYTPEKCTGDMWSVPYTAIRQANRVLEHIEEIDAESDSQIELRNSIKGQALAIRALAHFDLCRMFGLPYTHDDGASLGVPIITSILDWDAKKSRNTVKEVYNHVINDLNLAIPLMKTEVTDGYINHWAAKAILARVYLYKEENALAYDLAKDIIDNSPYQLVSGDKYVNSWADDFTSESIFSIANTLTDNGGLESIGNYADPDGYYIFAATKKLTLIFEDTDVRKELLYDDYRTYKYEVKGRVLKFPGKGNTKDKIVDAWENEKQLVNPAYTSNTPVLRLSELYLIAAEAAVKTNDKENATFYLNKIVERADPSATVAQADVDLDRILLERRKEFVSEGHRFFDLTRNKLDIDRPRLTKRQSSSVPQFIEWDNFKIVYPIPISEINSNANLIQNPGYSNK